jgi:acetyl-CoA carboxylase biotin carboxyl carrier protein
MDIAKIKELIELVKAAGVSELEIRQGDESLRITQNLRHDQDYPFIPQPQQPSAISDAKVEEVESGHKIKSPMIGTVYLAPTPGAEPFVKIGQRVNKGDTLCLIEAMKMFHKVEADISGVVSACIVFNATAVEYDQPLFIIDER